MATDSCMWLKSINQLQVNRLQKHLKIPCVPFALKMFLFSYSRRHAYYDAMPSGVHPLPQAKNTLWDRPSLSVCFPQGYSTCLTGGQGSYGIRLNQPAQAGVLTWAFNLHRRVSLFVRGYSTALPGVFVSTVVGLINLRSQVSLFLRGYSTCKVGCQYFQQG